MKGSLGNSPSQKGPRFFRRIARPQGFCFFPVELMEGESLLGCPWKLVKGYINIYTKTKSVITPIYPLYK